MLIVKSKFNPQIPLSAIENFVESKIGWEKGSYDVIKIAFSDKTEFVYINYPTDLSENQAELWLGVFDDQIEQFNKDNVQHPAVKANVSVNAGALKMALNVLRRAGKDEVADELEKTIHIT